MRSAPFAALALLTCLACTAHGAAPVPPWVGFESVATVEGAQALSFNPAALGSRYPGELLLAMQESGPSARAWGAFATGSGFGVMASGGEDGRSAWGLGLASGGRGLQVGASLQWLDGRGSRASDLGLGMLSRPTPWASLGATASHLAESQFEGERMGRDYRLGLGLRPLALARARAGRWGPRLTLSADVRLAEDRPSAAARASVGAELEALPGIAVRGAAERGGFRVGIALLGVRSGYHGDARYDRDGVRRSTSHALSFHAGEDRTVLAGPRARRVGELRVDGTLADESLAGLSIFGGSATRSVADLRAQLERALHDPLTRGVLLEPRGVANMAQLEELRARIAQLRAAGKPVVAFLEYGGGRGDLYLASACDRVVASEEAVFAGLGLRAERRSYRGLLESWGLRIDRASVGSYKSAYRNFSADSTPPTDRDQIEQLLDASQRGCAPPGAAARPRAPARLAPRRAGGGGPAPAPARAGLIDSVAYREQAMAMLGRLARLSDKPRHVALARLEPARRAWRVPRPVAVVYASGGIEVGGDGHDLLNGPYMGSESIARRLERAFRDPEVKAVVLRVESPGGSGLASNLILHQAARLKRETKKPLVVSMGSLAGSGGYYIALAADRIFADRYTRTGSIGVLYVKPSLEGWYRQHGVRQEAFERGPFMGGLSLGRDWTDRWQAAADSSVRFAYEIFKSKVAMGRGLDPAQVEAVARGRVWMGEEALERRLVDAIGGLDDAILEARRRALVPVGATIELAEFRRARPRLLERLAGMAARQALGSYGSFRLPEPGAIELRADVDLDD